MSRVKRYKAESFIEKLFCDCGGEMVATGFMLSSNPAQFPHICTECGASENVIGTSYPRPTTEITEQ